MSDTTQTTAGTSSKTDIDKFRDGETVYRTDTRGRKLEIRQLSLIEEMGLLAVAGARSDTRRWMMYATWICCVRSIDGTPSPLPANEKQLNGRIIAVEAEGAAAVALLLSEGVSAASGDDDEKAPVEVTAEDAAKN